QAEIDDGVYDYEGQDAAGEVLAQQALLDGYDYIQGHMYAVREVQLFQNIQHVSDIQMKAANHPDLSADFAQRNHDMATYQAAIEQTDVAAAAKASSARLEGAKARAGYLAKDKGHKLARRQVALDTAQAKQSAYQLEGGILNLNERLSFLQERILQDFSEAFGRIKALEAGISTVYLLSPSAENPANRVPDLPLLKAAGTLDRTISWLRSVHGAVIDARRYDQKMTIPISVRAHLDAAGADPKRQFKDGFSKAKWQFHLTAADF